MFRSCINTPVQAMKKVADSSRSETSSRSKRETHAAPAEAGSPFDSPRVVSKDKKKESEKSRSRSRQRSRRGDGGRRRREKSPDRERHGDKSGDKGDKKKKRRRTRRRRKRKRRSIRSPKTSSSRFWTRVASLLSLLLRPVRSRVRAGPKEVEKASKSALGVEPMLLVTKVPWISING